MTDKHQFNRALIEAEEDLLIDFQFLIEELISEKGLSRTALARRAGMSKARLSQIMNAEANPTVKTFARVLHALDEKIRLVRSRDSQLRLVPEPMELTEWLIDQESRRPIREAISRAAQRDLVSKEVAMADNDNQVLTVGSDAESLIAA